MKKIFKIFFIIFVLLFGMHLPIFGNTEDSVGDFQDFSTSDLHEPNFYEPGFFEPVFFDTGFSAEFFETITHEAAKEVETASIENTVEERRSWRIKNRAFELSIANISNFGLSNNFLSARDYIRGPFSLLFNLGNIMSDWTNIFNDNVIVVHNPDGSIFLDLGRLSIDPIFNDGFRLDIGGTVTPLSLNFNRKDRWGFGLDIGRVEVTGNLSLPENMLSLFEKRDTTFGVGAAAFIDFGIPTFFHVRDFRITFRPAAYLPVMYTIPAIRFVHSESVNSVTGARGSRISVDYDMRIFTPVRIMDDDGNIAINNINDISSLLRGNLGFDIGIGAEYSLFSWLDLGVNIVNLPFLGARLNHYLSFSGSAFIDTSYIDLNDLIGGGNLPDGAFSIPDADSIAITSGFNSNGEVLRRPFKMLFYANYRPFDRQILTVTPVLGFSINRLYPTPAAFEGGLNMRLDLANIFAFTFGMNYMDRKWINSFDFTLINLRLLQIDLGFAFQSPDFVRSWRGAGFGFNFALKMGW